MKNILIFLCCMVIISSTGNAQVAINAEEIPGDSSAMLDIKSDSRGMLMPRLTSVQITEIQNPEDGLQVYNTETGSIYIYVASSGAWKEIKYAAGTIAPYCGSSFTDARDGKSYNTVLIGTQCWMRQNLNVGTRIDGVQEQTNNSTIEKYCYDNIESNCDVYGGLYQWAEFVQYLNGATNATSWSPVPTGNVQGICPVGWHIPTYPELITITTFLGGESVVGGKMKETGTAHWASPNTGANNSSEFTALPGGLRWDPGQFTAISYFALFRASSVASSTYAFILELSYESSNVELYDLTSKAYGLSVRCIKD